MKTPFHVGRRVLLGMTVLCFLTAIAAAQSARPDVSDAIAALKQRKASVVSAVPEGGKLPQLIKLSPADAAALLVPTDGEDPCTVAKVVYFFQNIEGGLANTDCRLEDGSYADFYIFE